MTNIRGRDNYLMPFILYQISLGRKDYISIQSLVIRCRHSLFAHLCSKLGGFQHSLRREWYVVKILLEIV